MSVLQDGYWELTTELGELIHVDVDLFKGFLKSKGITSLGENPNRFEAFRVKPASYLNRLTCI